MPTGLERRFAALERQRVELLGRLAPLSDTQHSFQPDPSSWSLAGVVHHLVLVEERFVENGRARATRRPTRVTLQARVRQQVVLAVMARDIRVRAPSKAVVPRSHVPLVLLDARWRAARSALLDYLAELPGPIWIRSAFYHPGAGWITAAGGLRFLQAHTRHHLRQIDRILGAEGFPR
jgi:hypothetical protein